MATTVITPSGDGGAANIEDLTEMERFLIGMLGHSAQCYSSGYSTSCHRLMIYCKFNPVVTSITFSIKFTPHYGAAAPSDTPENKISIFGVYKGYADIRDGSTHTETIKPTGDNIEVNSLYSGDLTITSFTTTDGKVHTTDNLNY